MEFGRAGFLNLISLNLPDGSQVYSGSFAHRNACLPCLPAGKLREIKFKNPPYQIPFIQGTPDNIRVSYNFFFGEILDKIFCFVDGSIVPERVSFFDLEVLNV